MKILFHQTTALFVLLMTATISHGDEKAKRDGAIKYFADAVGTHCAQEVIDQLGISKELCDQRHMESVKHCKEVAATDLPKLLSRRELGRAMLRFTLCRGVVIQGEKFDLAAWEPTITRMLDEDRNEES